MSSVNKIHVGQGEQAVSSCRQTVATTVLGSCVSACLWDPVARIGGMNHILLPESSGSRMLSQSVGTNSMELLINALMHSGADKRRLVAKLFGGARMISGLSNVGERNSKFVSDFCKSEGIMCVGSSLGGEMGRRVEFRPSSGEARQHFLTPAATPVEIPSASVGDNVSSDVELFI